MITMSEEDRDEVLSKDEVDYLANFQGKTWIMKWNGVNFPAAGEYTIQAEGDDIVKVVDILKFFVVLLLSYFSKFF